MYFRSGGPTCPPVDLASMSPVVRRQGFRRSVDKTRTNTQILAEGIPSGIKVLTHVKGVVAKKLGCELKLASLYLRAKVSVFPLSVCYTSDPICLTPSRI